MKKIQIFFASSLSLKKDREELEIFFGRKNKELLKRNIIIELVIWEDFISTISKERLQNEYNKAILDSDLFVMLFFNKVGKYTEEEFDVAYSSFIDKGSPKILTFFKRIPILIEDIEEDEIASLFAFKRKLKEIQHFTSSYKNVDDLKVQIYDHLEKLDLVNNQENKNENQFSDVIKNAAENLDLKLEQLTKEQFRVIRQLRHFKRVRISGCAGSGKTLVAAEKAIRLSQAGLSTIILCHNPNLSSYFKKLVKGELIHVFSFEEWVHKLNQNDRFNIGEYKWSEYSEPTKGEIKQAMSNIESGSNSFDAVIIDEAQDFRKAWWDIVEKMMQQSNHKIIYIFNDDNQALLPFRSNYPIKNAVIDLSRNCRNAGKIYEYLRSNLHYSAPSVSEELKGLGNLNIFEYNSGNLANKINDSIKWLGEISDGNNIVVLLAGDLTRNDIDFDRIRVKTAIGTDWKLEILNQFQKILISPIKLKKVYEKNDVVNSLKQLSDSYMPNNEDLTIVSNVAQMFIISNQMKERYYSGKNYENNLYWKNKDGRIKLFNRRKSSGVRAIDSLNHFLKTDWSKGLYSYRTYELGEEFNDRNDYVAVVKTSKFKGLESDNVILIVRNKSYNIEKELYVGVSRAKNNLAILTDEHNKYMLKIKEETK